MLIISTADQKTIVPLIVKFSKEFIHVNSLLLMKTCDKILKIPFYVLFHIFEDSWWSEVRKILICVPKIKYHYVSIDRFQSY